MNIQPVTWKKYIDGRKNSPPKQLLLEALTHVRARDLALDLGAGPMNDCRHLLTQDFKKVIAVDYDDTAEEYASEFAEDSRFVFVKSVFDQYAFPSGVDLLNASYSLPFNRRETFREVVQKARNSLKEGGVFCGQFFGDKDDWNVPGTTKNYISRQEAEKLLHGMEILKFFEEEADHKSALGEMKHWHTFHFIARK